MDEVPTWTVVQFLNDGTVEAVPSNWIQGEICHWPSFAHQKLITAIKKCEPLNTCWPSHNVKIFRNATFGKYKNFFILVFYNGQPLCFSDDYIKARNKTKVAEDTSDINTTTDDQENERHEKFNKRKRIKKVLSSSDEESGNETLLSTPPAIARFKSKF